MTAGLQTQFHTTVYVCAVLHHADIATLQQLV